MGSAWLKLRWFLAYWISRIGLAVGRHLPARLLYRIADPFALLAYVVLHRQRRNLTRNLAAIVGPKQAPALARRVFRNFARYIIDFYRLPYLGKQALWRRVDFQGWQTLDEALEADNGTIFVTLHLGQAELGAAALAAYGRSVSVIAETFEYAPMNRFLQNLRRRLGMKIIPAKTYNPDLLRCLNRGEVLGLMFDAVEAGAGTRVNFLGGTAEFSATPARLAIRTGARVLPAVISRQAGKEGRFLTEVDFTLDFSPTGDVEADVANLTQEIAAAFEPMVKRHVDQWFAFGPALQAEPPAAATKTTAAWMTRGLAVAAAVGGLVPARVSYAFARIAGDVAYHLRSATRENVRDNMRQVMGPEASKKAVDRATHEVFRNVTRYYVDLIRLPHTRSQDITQGHVKIHGLERLKEAINEGRGVVVAGPHLGSPEMGAQAGALLGLDVMILIEPLQPPLLAETMSRLRMAHGARYETVGVRSVGLALRHLRRGGVLGILCDRDIQGTGMVMDFFNKPARIPTGAIEIAGRTGAILMPAYSLRTASRIDLHFGEPIDFKGDGRDRREIARDTKVLMEAMEPLIRRDPGQWIVLEKIWDRDLPAPLQAGASSCPSREEGGPGPSEPELAASTGATDRR